MTLTGVGEEVCCHACEGRPSHFEERTKFTLLRPATEEEVARAVLGVVANAAGLD